MFFRSLVFIMFFTLSLFFTACGDSAKRTTVSDVDNPIVDKGPTDADNSDVDNPVVDEDNAKVDNPVVDEDNAKVDNPVVDEDNTDVDNPVVDENNNDVDNPVIDEDNADVDNPPADIDNAPECLAGETRSCYDGPVGTKGKGICKAGTQTCTSDDVWGACKGEVLPTQETCNGKDDDCNGTADNGFDLTTDLENCGACGNSCNVVNPVYKNTVATIECDGTCKYTCALNYYDIDGDKTNGCEYSCVKSNGGVEKCDGLDNDCDGQVDEGLTCNCSDGNSQTCTVANTSCNGNQTCTSGSWDTCTTTRPNTGIEKCDGYDNDCSGKADEPFMDDTQTHYIVKDHCGACNKKCEDFHTSSNECNKSGTNIGKCNPNCKTGFFNADGNGWNGCETGCEPMTKAPVKMAGGNSTNDIYGTDADTVVVGNSVVVVYVKKEGSGSTTLSNIYMKKYSLTGKQIMAEKKLIDSSAGSYAQQPSIAYQKTSNKLVLVFYYSYAIKYRVFDINGNTVSGQPIQELASDSNKNIIPHISKNVDSKNRFFVSWKHSTGYSYVTKYAYINSDFSHTSSSTIYKNFNSIEVATSSSMQAILGCERISSTKSELYLYIKSTQVKSLLIGTYTNAYCGNYSSSISTTPSSNYFIVSRDTSTSDKKIYVEKYFYDGGSNTVKKSTSSTTIAYTPISNKLLKTSIYYNPAKQTFLISYAFNNSFYNPFIGKQVYTSSVYYERLKSNLALIGGYTKVQNIYKNANSDIRVFALDSFYTDSKNVVITSLTKSPTNYEADLMTTQSCLP